MGRNTGVLVSERRPSARACCVPGCIRPFYAREYCNLHWSRMRAYGSTDDPRLSHEHLFWSKVEKTDHCWIWTGRLAARGGYGVFLKATRAHRFSYEIHHGPIPPGMLVDHTCHNHACVNPAHLRIATQKQNGENRSGPSRANKTSGVRGVSWDKSRNKWQVSVGHAGQHYSAGRFDSLSDAEQAAIELRNRLFTHNDEDRQSA